MLFSGLLLLFYFLFAGLRYAHHKGEATVHWVTAVILFLFL